MAAPSTEDVSKWHRWFAIEMNNLAWQHAEKPTRPPEEEEEMIHAAHAAALHWMQDGKEVNRARADMLLGQAHALAGNGKLAMFYAQRSIAYFSASETKDWEMAFVHAVLANAARTAGTSSTYAEHFWLAERLGATIADPEDREIFERTFHQIPSPA